MAKTKQVSESARWWSIFQLFVFLLCVVALGDAIGKARAFPGLIDFLLSFALLYAAWWPLILIHELGHAAFARLAGWRAPLIAVRGFTIWTEGFRVRHGLPAFAQQGGGTFVLPPARSDWREWRLGYLFLLIGGSSANLVLALILGVASTYVTGPVLSRLLGTTAFLSGFTGFSNLLPIRWHRWRRTDGAMIWDAIWGEDLQVWEHSIRLFEDKVCLRRPRDWNLERVTTVQRDSDRGNAAGSQALFEYHLDSEDVEAARKALSSAEIEFGSVDSIHANKAFLIAHADGDAGAAELELSHIKARSSKRMPEYWRAVAAIEAARGDAVAMEAALRRARAAIRRAPFASAFDFEILDRIESCTRIAPVTSEEVIAAT